MCNKPSVQRQWTTTKQEMLHQAKPTILSPTSPAHLHMWRNSSDAAVTVVCDSRLAQKRPQLSNTFITGGFKGPWRLFAWSHQGPKDLHKLLCLVKGRLRKIPSAAPGLSIRSSLPATQRTAPAVQLGSARSSCLLRSSMCQAGPVYSLSACHRAKQWGGTTSLAPPTVSGITVHDNSQIPSVTPLKVSVSALNNQNKPNWR